ncbi:MAG: hypothetical protein VCA34_02320 [Roseibacillus sp.]
MEGSFYEAWDVTPDFLKLGSFLDMEFFGSTLVFAMIFLIGHCTTSFARLRSDSDHHPALGINSCSSRQQVAGSSPPALLQTARG